MAVQAIDRFWPLRIKMLHILDDINYGFNEVT